MNNKAVPPSISSVSFSCPHCGAHADQTWYDIYAVPVEKHGTPFRADETFLEILRRDKNLPEEVRDGHIGYTQRSLRGEVFFEHNEKSHYREPDVVNLSISCCYSCEKLSVWVHDRVLHPPVRVGIEPNG